MHIVKIDEFWHSKVSTDVQDSDMYKIEKKTKSTSIVLQKNPTALQKLTGKYLIWKMQ